MTDELAVRTYCNELGIHFLLVEIYQAHKRIGEAVFHADALVELKPYSEEALVSFAEVVLDQPEIDNNRLKKFLSLTKTVENEDAVSTVVYLYRALALKKMGLTSAAIDLLTQAARRKKDRPTSIINRILYERALLLIDDGKKARAKKDFEKIYASDPDFEDVGELLGLS